MPYISGILCEEETGVKATRPKAIWHNAAAVAGEGFHGIRGTVEGDLITPDKIKYVIVIWADQKHHRYDEQIVAWESFEKSGDPKERVEINLIKGIHPELFLQFFAEAYGKKKYILLPHRGGVNTSCYHLEPVPELLKESVLMGLGGAFSTDFSKPADMGYCGVLLGP